MKLKVEEVREYIKKETDELQPHLSLRIMALMDQFRGEDLDDLDEIDIFDLMVKLILRADSDPAGIISNLLVPLNTEGSYQLDDHTISNAGSFLRDYIKKDYLHYILKTKVNDKKEKDHEEEE
jgi:hypothetical protein